MGRWGGMGRQGRAGQGRAGQGMSQMDVYSKSLTRSSVLKPFPNRLQFSGLGESRLSFGGWVFVVGSWLTRFLGWAGLGWARLNFVRDAVGGWAGLKLGLKGSYLGCLRVCP
jgi:hypothetical protein